MLSTCRGERPFGSRHGGEFAFQSFVQRVRCRADVVSRAASDLFAIEALLRGRQERPAGRLLGQLLGGSWMFGAAFMIF
jgi:hypothetical protein